MSCDIPSLRRVEKLLLVGKDLHSCVESKLLSVNIGNGDFVKALSLQENEEIFASHLDNCDPGNIETFLRNSIDHWRQLNPAPQDQFHLLSLGAAALLAFIQDNFTGPPLTESVQWIWFRLESICSRDDLKSHLISVLELDGESVHSVTRHPELLLLARAVLLTDLPDLMSSLWWRFRCLAVHQQILEEWSPQLHTQMVSLIETLKLTSELTQDSTLNVLLCLEQSQMHLMYHEVQPSNAALTCALKEAGLTMDLIGALGKRTRFQHKDLAQLTLRVEASEDKEWFPKCPINDLPKDLMLNDDVRLEKIAYTNITDGSFADLSPLQLACVLGMFVQTQKSQPKDKLADEELLAYLSCLLSQPHVWAIQLSSLMFRCRIESNHSRTIERSMCQTQALVDAVDAAAPGPWSRLPLVFSAHMCTRWHLEEELADRLVSLGCVNSALDIYLRLDAWEQVIACYNHLKLRHKAAEIIKQELKKKETVKLWCLLGDATDDTECYEKAWILSNECSGRAQRHWGLYYFNHKQYSSAIPHLQKSLTLNSLQVKLWFQLGYAALHEEEWSIAATAYRRCCVLDPENFEAWNNLAKAYVKEGQKNRAWKALQEALKFNYENWRVWDNFMVVSLDCSVMEEVIRAYHRILDLKEKHVDTEVLEILAKAVIEDLPDADGVPCGRLQGKAVTLFGRITAQVTSSWKVWQLYSRLSATTSPSTPEAELRTVQHMQKALRAAVVDPCWIRDTSTCHKVLELSVELSEVTLNYVKKNATSNQSASVLSSAKLSVKAVLSKMKQERWDLLTNQIEGELLPDYQRVEGALEEILLSSQSH